VRISKQKGNCNARKVPNADPACGLSDARRSAPARGRLRRPGRTRICYKFPMHASGVQHLLPIASVVAGVFLLVGPRIVSFAVAVYLIFVGLLGLNGIYHIVK
jgi:Protein of unknown function (DUF3096)